VTNNSYLEYPILAEKPSYIYYLLQTGCAYLGDNTSGV